MQPIWIDDCIYKQTVYRFCFRNIPPIVHIELLDCPLLYIYRKSELKAKKMQLKCKQLNEANQLNVHSMEQECDSSSENENSARGETKRDTVERPKQWWVAYNL